MALFTDFDVVTLDDLLRFENTLVQVSSTHGIDIHTKITLASDEISDRLMLWLLRAGASDPQWSMRGSLGLSTVVVSSGIYRWICFNSLARVFAEAYNLQLNTRFQGKWTEYQQQASTAAEMVRATGIGLVSAPLPKPELPIVSVTSGSLGLPAIFVRTAWTDIQGRESAAGPILGNVLNGASSIEVSMAASEVPTAARGWNIYAGQTDAKLTRQNLSPIPVGLSWPVSVSGLVEGAEPGTGQQPELTVSFTQRWPRG